MRDLRVLGATTVCAVLLGACAALPGSTTATTVGFEVLEFTRQAQFPGVESNLYATEVHRVKLSGNFTEGAQRFELWVDSVALPVRLVQNKSGMAMDMAPGRRLDVRFASNRHMYRQGTSGAMVLPQETYRLTGKMLEGGEAWFVFSDRWGNETRWNLGAPSVLPNLYAP
ncbi:MAG: hypothetical protein ACPG66_01970 [Flavobacteriales bacterium]